MFFGVPNRGLNHTSLVSIVQGQPNEGLIRDLQVNEGSEQSSFLRGLCYDFEGIFHQSDSEIIDFYEDNFSDTLQVRKRTVHDQ